MEDLYNDDVVINLHLEDGTVITKKRGEYIKTQRGDVFVEDLKEGDDIVQ